MGDLLPPASYLINAAPSAITAGDRAHPDLRVLQGDGVDAMQQENLQLLSKRIGALSIPVPLLAPVAAYALLADRLLAKTAYAMPYRAAGVLDLGADLLSITDSMPSRGV